MKDNVKVIIWGFGAMGSGMAQMLTEKKGVEIVGAIVRETNANYGKDMYQVLGVDRGDRPEVVFQSVDEVIKPQAADVVMIGTDSFTADSMDKMRLVLENKMNVITTAEEMAYPQAQSPELAQELDELAKANGVTILGTGINPGHIMDSLVLMMTGCMSRVDHILSRRVNSLSPFGKTVMHEQGIGMEVDDFNAKKERGEMSGHVGFPESISMIADGLGWKLDKWEQQMEPIVTEVDRKSPHGFAKAGQVAGVSMTAQGYVDGEVKINMEHPQQIEPEQVGVTTGDYVIIKGYPNINLLNSPEVEGGIGTIAMCVNMIPHVINARPGLKTMLDLPIPRAIMGDMRDMIEE